MSNYDVGKSYEDFVEMVYTAILETAKRNGQIGHVTLERRKKIISKSGTPAEIDIYWEYTLAGIINAVAIECKNYNKNVDIPSVRDFARKISDVSGLKGVIVTKKGFSKNAIDEATADNIDLLIIREKREQDWDGYLKVINTQIHMQPPVRIIAISPRLDKKWALEKGYTKGAQIQLNVRNDLLVFEDKDSNFKHSLLDLENNNFFEEKSAGKHQWKKNFDDGWMIVDTDHYKIDDVMITYVKPEIYHSEANIDFEDYVLAVMEYINGNNKKFDILKSGEKKEY